MQTEGSCLDYNHPLVDSRAELPVTNAIDTIIDIIHGTGLETNHVR